MAYIDEFQAAIDRTRRLGLAVPTHDLAPSARYLTAKHQREFPGVALRAIGRVGLDELVAQCLSIHHRLQGPIAQWLGVPTVYTIGWVQTAPGKGLYEFDEAYVQQLLAAESTPHSLPIHVWLTLPSMEVIDLSLPTSMAVVHKMPDGRGAVIAKHVDELTGGIAYKPMLVGNDLLRRIGVLVEM